MPDDLITCQKGNSVKRRGLKRKRRQRKSDQSDIEYNIDSYSAKIKRQNTSADDSDQNESFIGDQDCSKEFQVPKGRMSREERKLQYYLDSIKRQEKEEIRKSKRKPRKPNTGNKKAPASVQPDLGEFKQPLQISLVKDSDPELDEMSAQLAESLSSRLKNFWDKQKKYKADEDISCSQSEDQNESTFENQRTPTLTTLTLTNLGDLCDVETDGEAMGLSNYIEKSSISSSELGENTQDLKKQFWENLLKLTAQRQKELKDAKRAWQKPEIEEIKIYRPKPYKFKAVFKITRSNRL